MNPLTNLPLRVLVVEDSSYDAELVIEALKPGGFDPTYQRVETPQAMQAALEDQAWDVVLSDYSMPLFSGPDALTLLKETGIDIPFIIISGAIGEDIAVASLKAGAHDFLVKGQLNRLIPAVNRELREADSRKARKKIEQQFEATFEQAAVGMAHVAADGTWLRVNRKYCEILGYTHEELMGMTFMDSALLEKLQKRQTNNYSSEQRYLRPDQSIVWVNLTVSAVWDVHGNFSFAVAIIEDITEKKHAERKSQFLANMSHELRTPLNAIIGFSQLLVKESIGALNDKQRQFVQNVVANGKRLLELINQILDASQIESGNIELSLEQAEIEPLIESSKTDVAELALQKNVSLLWEIQPCIGSVQIDPIRFKQILVNLLSNAIKFNHDHGTVTVKITKNDRWFQCSIQDTGMGISPKQLSELFQPFFQADMSYARKYEGAGLGLALTKNLIECHGGILSVTSQEGIGSTFTFQLPAEPEP